MFFINNSSNYCDYLLLDPSICKLHAFSLVQPIKDHGETSSDRRPVLRHCPILHHPARSMTSLCAHGFPVLGGSRTGHHTKMLTPDDHCDLKFLEELYLVCDISRIEKLQRRKTVEASRILLKKLCWIDDICSLTSQGCLGITNQSLFALMSQDHQFHTILQVGKEMESFLF